MIPGEIAKQEEMQKLAHAARQRQKALAAADLEEQEAKEWHKMVRYGRP